MKNKDFYFIENGNQIGPISIEDLLSRNLPIDTLVWTEDMDDWQMIKDIPELKIITKTTPPPIPKKKEENITKTEVSGELKVITEKTSNQTIKKITPSNSALKIFLIWSGIHLFALITSYSKIDVFSDGPETDKFWPFVEFVDENKYFQEDYSYSNNSSSFRRGEWKKN